MGKYDLTESNDTRYNRTVYKFPTRGVMSNYPNQYWSVDLVDMSKRPENGYSYIMNIVDVHSRKLISYPMKTKTGNEIKNTLQKAIKQYGKPNKIWTDKEGGILANETQEYLKKLGIETYHTYGKGKSAIVEALNKTQKTAIEKATKSSGTWKTWVPKFEEKYNKTAHGSTGTEPNKAFYHRDAGMAQTNNLLNALLHRKNASSVLSAGQKVRLQIKKAQFEKGYTQRWTTEIFTISEVKKTNPITYSVKDKSGEIVQGSFYRQELQAI